MIIKILWTWCKKCKLLQKTVEDAVKKMEIDCTIVKVDDMQEITKYDIMSMPWLVIDDELILSWWVPDIDEIIDILTDFQSGTGMCCGGSWTCDTDGNCCGGCHCE
jgi:small redox-active disulfide protein 2